MFNTFLFIAAVGVAYHQLIYQKKLLYFIKEPFTDHEIKENFAKLEFANKAKATIAAEYYHKNLNHNLIQDNLSYESFKEFYQNISIQNQAYIKRQFSTFLISHLRLPRWYKTRSCVKFFFNLKGQYPSLTIDVTIHINKRFDRKLIFYKSTEYNIDIHESHNP